MLTVNLAGKSHFMALADVQLDVKSYRDIYSSFCKYVEVEHIEGDSKYHAENHGLQDAKKGVLFLDYPPVLQLQLKSLEYMRIPCLRSMVAMSFLCNSIWIVMMANTILLM